jgi:hypothetical protein
MFPATVTAGRHDASPTATHDGSAAPRARLRVGALRDPKEDLVTWVSRTPVTPCHTHCHGDCHDPLHHPRPVTPSPNPLDGPDHNGPPFGVPLVCRVRGR